MFQFFANIFGYILNFINNIVGNYGLAIIIFTVLIKILMLPLSIKQQKTMKKSEKLQNQIKALQFKYKNDQETLNREMMALYKKENMSPFSGCLTAIVQFILLISVFYMVRFPLTYMVGIDKDQINTYIEQMKQDNIAVSQGYAEIDVIRELNYLKEKFPDDQNLNKINLNMNFCGLDLSKIPQQNLTDWTVYIIPLLYILSTFVSMRMTSNTKKPEKNNNLDKEEEENKDKKEKNEGNDMEETLEQSNKMMSWMMPIMSVSISLVAPLGLALYWLVNNILMIFEKIFTDRVIKD